MQPPTSKVGSGAGRLRHSHDRGRATPMECGGLPPLWGVGWVPGAGKREQAPALHKVVQAVIRHRGPGQAPYPAASHPSVTRPPLPVLRNGCF